MKQYTVSEIAALLFVNEETVRRWIRGGKLKSEQTSRKTGNIISNESLTEFLKTNSKYSKSNIKKVTQDTGNAVKAVAKLPIDDNDDYITEYEKKYGDIKKDMIYDAFGILDRSKIELDLARERYDTCGRLVIKNIIDAEGSLECAAKILELTPAIITKVLNGKKSISDNVYDAIIRYMQYDAIIGYVQDDKGC